MNIIDKAVALLSAATTDYNEGEMWMALFYGRLMLTFYVVMCIFAIDYIFQINVLTNTLYIEYANIAMFIIGYVLLCIFSIGSNELKKTVSGLGMKNPTRTARIIVLITFASLFVGIWVNFVFHDQ